MTFTQIQGSITSQKRPAASLEHSENIANTSPKLARNSNGDNVMRNKPASPQHSGIKPSGNLLFEPRASIRKSGLGHLNNLSDPLVLSIVTLLAAKDVLYLGSCSKTLFAYCAHQPIWKDLYIRTANGKLAGWAGTWRQTYLQYFTSVGIPRPSLDSCMRPLFATPAIDCTGLFSDELYQPYLCATADVRRYFYPPNRRSGTSSASRFNIPRIEASSAEGRFARDPELASEPFVVTGALKHLGWPAFSEEVDEKGIPTPRWAIENLLRRYPKISFRAEAFDCSLQTYCDYAENCSQDDAPLYLFDSRFVEKTAQDEEPGMGADYTPPSFLSEDLFTLMGEKRPDYRWLIVGPERSGSTFHKDPNATSAWNAVITGSKGWVMFPPDVCPPGVYVSEDEAEVTSPLSLPEWFISFFDAAWSEYGPNARSEANRGKMRMGVCEAGEIVYVPSGWWHLVVNLEASVAVTQNFASEYELVNVLRFMKNKADQTSGWAEDIACGDLYGIFCDVLRRERPEVLDNALKVLEKAGGKGVADKQSVWDQVTKSAESEVHGGFSFGFEVDGSDIE